jgi:hypothetical protein
MLKNIKEIQDFVIWCQKNKVKSFKNNDLEFELSELGMVETQNFDEINLDDSKTFSDFDNMTKEEQDELLFWSSGKK